MIAMTKAKARARAKARAAAKLAKPDVQTEKPEVVERPGHVKAKAEAVRNLGGAANIKSVGAMRRGAARSR